LLIGLVLVMGSACSANSRSATGRRQCWSSGALSGPHFAALSWSSVDAGSQPVMTHQFKQIFRRIMRPRTVQLPAPLLARAVFNDVSPSPVIPPQPDFDALAGILPLQI
jgi:hypothetical protein